MKTDRELLALAAKAAGKTNWQASTFYSDARCDSEGVPYWNPLTDDGDALRLAVKRSIDVHCASACGYSVATVIVAGVPGIIRIEEYHSAHDGDQNAATRRAIVRAAAKIGKAMP